VSNLLAIAAAATAAASLPGVSAGQFTHILVNLSRADVDATKIRLTVVQQRDGGQESVIPGITLDVFLDVCDALGLGAVGGRNVAALQTANAAPAAGDNRPVSFAIPIGTRRMVGKSTLSVTFAIESALTGTYTAVLYDEGANRPQSLPIQYAAVDTGAAGRPNMIFAFRSAVGTAAGDIMAATAASLAVTLTVDGEGSHTISGAQLSALGSLHDGTAAPTRAVRIYSAPDVQPAVSITKLGTDATNWQFLCMQIPDVAVDAMQAEGAARAQSLAAKVAAIPPERRKSLRNMGVLAPLSAYQEQADKFSRKGG